MSLRRFFILPYFATLCGLPGLAQITLNPAPTRVIGQTSLTISGTAPNLVEGRELSAPLGIALDASANPPHLYVADTGNHRVLGWMNAGGFTNGQKADIVIGQPDFVTVFPEGPRRGTSPRQTGLTAPVGLAVDAKGNLYIADCGNNRVLRFPQPFAQSPSNLFPDLVIGQSDFTTNASNLNGIGASTLSTNPGSVFTAYVTIDAAGNLWVADAGNNRVLRFPAATLASGVNGASADIVLGQPDFVSSSLPGYSLQSLSEVQTPTGLAFDNEGNLYVSESTSNQHGRVLVFSKPANNGQLAIRQIGVPSGTQATPVNALQIGAGSSALSIYSDGLVVADSTDNRLLFYPPLGQWTSDHNSQPASFQVGQTDFTTSAINNAKPQPDGSTLSSPSQFAYSSALGGFVADSGNNRVIVLAQAGSLFGPATKVLGQDGITFNTVNLIEGREFRFDGSASLDAGIVIDLQSNPPHLYVADTYNNRVLGFNDVRKVQPGSKADIVIGQLNFQTSLVNYPANAANMPNQSGLNAPIGLVLDSSGNLYVADSGNGRVLRFPTPFAKPQNLPNADIVIGQASFTSQVKDASASTMASPYGLAFATANGLLVSDTSHNRVLFFPGAPADLKTGMAASIVFGQPDFSGTNAGNSSSQFNFPRHIATDKDDRLYVADTGNTRVLIFNRAPLATNNAASALTLGGFTSPRGIFVNKTTGEIWVADFGDSAGNNSRALRFPFYDQLAITPQSNATLSEAVPLALAQDSSGALYVADATNRVIIHYPGVAGANAANFLGPCIPNVSCAVDRALAPGTIVSLYSTSGQAVGFFGTMTAPASAVPLPTTLADLQVSVNGTAVPLFYASPAQINFFMPNGAPTSGTVLIEVTQASTGQVLGSSYQNMAPTSPGLFTSAGNGIGQVAAVNQDGTINSQSHPAPWNSVVSFYGTGTGMIPGAPPDGTPPTAAISTALAPRVAIGSQYVPDADILYSGLAPGFVGLWQINVQIPNTVAPTTASSPTPVVISLDSVFSGGALFGRPVTMWVKSN